MIIKFIDGPIKFKIGLEIFMVNGACNLGDKVVLINRTSGSSTFIKNFIHELGHMILPKNPINPAHDAWDYLWITLRKYGVI